MTGDTMDSAGSCCNTSGGEAGTSVDGQSRQLAFWNPQLEDPDKELEQSKPVAEGRAVDYVNNSGFASGVLDMARDKVVGHRFRLVLRPLHSLLGITAEAAAEWAAPVERMFQAYFDDPECYIDAGRRRTGPQIARASVVSDMLHGEAIATREYRDDNPGFKTCFQLIAPNRVSTPSDSLSAIDGKHVVMGVELGERYGDPLAYYIKSNHRDGESEKWKRVPRVNSHGVLNVFHVFESYRGSARGRSPLASVLEKMKMMDRYEDVELEAAHNAASYAMSIESEFGAQSAFEALGGSPTETLGHYTQAQNAFNKASPLMHNGLKIPHLFPNEKLNMHRAEHPNSGFTEFEATMLRHLARATGQTYEQVSADYSKVNYSSARAAEATARQSTLSKRAAVPGPICTMMVRAWLDEAIATGVVSLPAGVVNYAAARSHLTRCSWIGSGRAIIDEVKHAKANQVKLSTGETNLQIIAAENGQDWEEVLEQSYREKAAHLHLQKVYGIATIDSTDSQNSAKSSGTKPDDEDETEDPDEDDSNDSNDGDDK